MSLWVWGVHPIAQASPLFKFMKMKLLVCDDNFMMRRIESAILDTAGHQVETAIDGQDAFENIRANPNMFDVLITDNQMPRLTGVELVDKLRAFNVQIKVILVSAFLIPLVAETKRRLQLDGILQKPFTSDELLDCVKKLA